jgi:hypothetical protein
MIRMLLVRIVPRRTMFQALMILEQLMEAVNPNVPIKSCNYFDMTGGTSTGRHSITVY